MLLIKVHNSFTKNKINWTLKSFLKLKLQKKRLSVNFILLNPVNFTFNHFKTAFISSFTLYQVKFKQFIHKNSPSNFPFLPQKVPLPFHGLLVGGDGWRHLHRVRLPLQTLDVARDLGVAGDGVVHVGVLQSLGGERYGVLAPRPLDHVENPQRVNYVFLNKMEQSLNVKV